MTFLNFTMLKDKFNVIYTFFSVKVENSTFFQVAVITKKMKLTNIAARLSE